MGLAQLATLVHFHTGGHRSILAQSKDLIISCPVWGLFVWLLVQKFKSYNNLWIKTALPTSISSPQITQQTDHIQ